jgi:hypothetical protein
MNGFHKPETCVNGRTDAFARVADCRLTKTNNQLNKKY